MQLDALTFIIYALAAFRLTRVVTTDTILESVREKIWKRFPPSHGFGYLITCSWCSGFYVSILIVGLHLLVPTVAYVVSLVLSISAIVGLVAARLDR
jgi:hypothetical protein